MNKELAEDTRRFLRDLDGLLIHIAVYVVVNIGLVVVMFTDFNSLWWILLPLIFWSLILIYHALQMARRKNTTIKRILLGFFITN